MVNNEVSYYKKSERQLSLFLFYRRFDFGCSISDFEYIKK
jgi:hypothetical protein